MTRIALCATVSVLLAPPALAQDIDASRRQVPDVERHVTSAQGTPGLLSFGAGDGVALLRQYGGRFEKAIELIDAATSKPGWGWEDDCGHDGPPLNFIPNT